MKALLLSAGFGTRLRDLEDKIAKPAVPFFNLPLLAYPLYYLREAGITDLIVNTHHLPDSIQKAVTDLRAVEFQTHFLHESPEILLGGGAVANAASLLQQDTEEDFFYCNGDSVFLAKDKNIFSQLMKRHKDTKAVVTLLTTDHPELSTKFEPLYFDAEGGLQKIGGASEENLHPAHFIGMMAMNRKILDYLPPSGPSHIFHDGLIPLIKDNLLVGQLHIPSTELKWFEMGNKESFLQAQKDWDNFSTDLFEKKRLEAIQTSYKIT